MPSFGLIGNPVEHSLSPALHRIICEITGYDGDYSRFLVRQNDIPEIIPAIKRLGISGINVTSPHKQAILPQLDEVSPEALEIGAVNTVRIRRNGTTIGYNTDYFGFAESLLYSGIEIKGGSFAVCGISGAGMAACYALSNYGAAKVVKVSTNPQKGVSYERLEALGPMDCIVNCTTLGMADKAGESPVKPELMRKFSAAADMIYNPWETAFLHDAKAAGIKAVNGLPMLVLQGIRSFELWTDISVSKESYGEIIERMACIFHKRHV